MLTVISTHEIAMSKAAQRRTWESFLNGGTNHSANASTLPYIIRRCEAEKIPYVLTAVPGTGYFITHMQPVWAKNKGQNHGRD